MYVYLYVNMVFMCIEFLIVDYLYQSGTQFDLNCLMQWIKESKRGFFSSKIQKALMIYEQHTQNLSRIMNFLSFYL